MNIELMDIKHVNNFFRSIGRTFPEKNPFKAFYKGFNEIKKIEEFISNNYKFFELSENLNNSGKELKKLREGIAKVLFVKSLGKVDFLQSDLEKVRVKKEDRMQLIKTYRILSHDTSYVSLLLYPQKVIASAREALQEMKLKADTKYEKSNLGYEIDSFILSLYFAEEQLKSNGLGFIKNPQEKPKLEDFRWLRGPVVNVSKIVSTKNRIDIRCKTGLDITNVDINWRYTFANGDIFEGDLKNYKFEGKGKYFFANGDIYEGWWKNCKHEGKGKFIFTNGDVYKGYFKEGKFNGKGKYFFANGDFYKGEWKDDEYNGKGKIIFAKGGFYEGDFKNGLRHGKGKRSFENGDVYEGDFNKGLKHGKGKYTFANGHVFEGDFENGYAVVKERRSTV